MPDSLWRWKNFSPAEIACRGTGQLKLHPEALDKLQALRDRLERMEGDIRAMRNLMFEAFQRRRDD